METVFGRLLGLWRKPPAFLSGGEENSTKWELIKLNIKRERVLTAVLIAFLMIIITCILFADKIPSINKYISKDSIYIHSALIVFATQFLILTKNKEKNHEDYSKFYTLHILTVYIVMISCSLIAINNETANQRPFAYIIAMYSIASLVLLNRNERLSIYFASYIIYIGGCLYKLGLTWRMLEIIIYTLPLLVLALIVSNINYNAFCSNIMYKKLIEQKNEQLSDMYKTSEENLKLRTEQLNYAMELDKMKASFFSNISHELRTPLNIINSAEQMLRLILNNNEDIQPRRMEIIRYNDMVQQNCYRLIRLIENLIDVTEIDAGQADIKLGCYDIVKLVESVTLAASEYIKDKNINLEFSSSLDNFIMVCDTEKIERIMLNLLSNAVKFTPENGMIQVAIKGCRKKLVISVRDTGIGIPEALKKSVFDPFVQVDQSTSRMREGSGIGLTIVRAFVEMHRGNIYVISEEGQGSEFVIELPADLSSCTEEVSKLASKYRFHEKIKMEFSDYYN